MEVSCLNMCVVASQINPTVTVGKRRIFYREADTESQLVMYTRVVSLELRETMDNKCSLRYEVLVLVSERVSSEEKAQCSSSTVTSQMINELAVGASFGGSELFPFQSHH
jgi:hypothetical protein